jgi:MurNAc alpha-1-phosphate uridylyltransferase
MHKNFSAMILAAGFGSRLMPLTKDLPKPLININGITLLENSINFLKKLGCKKIVINSHYKYKKIQEFLKKRKDKNDIFFIYEKEILDTGGGVKNAIDYFTNKNIIVINSDIFWQKDNLYDARKLIKKYTTNLNPQLLLVDKKNAYGLDKPNGDFILRKSKILKFKIGDPILYYSGLQIINTDILSEFKNKIFSFNEVWRHLIDNQVLHGQIMTTNWYHVGDIRGLTIAKKLIFSIK